MSGKRQKWESGVYGKKSFPKLSDEWKELRKFIIKKYHFTCLRCDKRFRAYDDLTVHHLLPREDGGGDNVENLVALCSPCHDFVECENLRTKAEIIGSYDTPTEDVIVLPEGSADKSRPEWHAWVYGGCKNPLCQRE